MTNNLELLLSRHSVRSFSTEAVDVTVIKKLKAEVVMTNSHEQGMRFQIITGDAKPMSGYSHSYGMFRNAVNYLAAVVDVATPDAIERAGFFGQRFVMKAVGLGLGTCFVGGTFDSSSVRAQVRAGEKILFLIVFGYPEGNDRVVSRILTKITHRKKIKPEDFFIPKDELGFYSERSEILQEALRALACAPSAMNRRPVRLTGEKSGENVKIEAKVDEETTFPLIDLGIAKFNICFATDTLCDWGNGGEVLIQ